MTTRKASDLLRVEFSRRIRESAPPEWQEFTRLWMAFNAIYGGEPDAGERARAMSAVRRYVPRHAALRARRASERSIDSILALPPGNMLLESWNSRFREASRRCAAMYHWRSGTAQTRLAGVAGVLYQVRCSLLHGSKDPSSPRDPMLVRESIIVLGELVPALEKGLAAKSK